MSLLSSSAVALIAIFGICHAFKAPSLCPDFPSCDCQPIGDQFIVLCSGTDNLTDVQALLKAHFLQRTIFKLYLVNCTVTSFPDNVFDGFNIISLQLSCPFEEITENAVRNISGLERLYLFFIKFSEIPVGLHNLTAINTETFQYCNITEISTELRNLRNLIYFSITRCTLQTIAEDAFIDNTEMKDLYLSNNEIEFIYTNTFDSMTSLELIYLDGNHLHTIDGLFKKLSPVSIKLYNNNLTNIDCAFQHSMKHLVTLDIGKNPITFLNSTALNTMPRLAGLYLRANKFSTLDSNLLQPLIQLKKVDLSFNKIVTIPDGFFHNLVNLEEIDLSHNWLSSVSKAFVNIRQLKTLHLEYNVINSIGNTFDNLSQLTDLRLVKNYFRQINDGDLYGMPLLEELDVGQSFVEIIHSNAFSKLKNLKRLKINHNRLTHFNYSIKDLYSLTNLTARYGLLSYIKDDEMENLPKLQYLNLLNNNLVQIDGAFNQLFSLTYLNLAQNMLTILSRDTFPEVIRLQELFLASNKFQCDCRLLWFVEYLHGSGKNVLKDKPMCHLPMRLRGIYFQNLTSDDLTEWPDGCFKPWCSCRCVPQNREFYVEVDCSHGNLTSVPDILPDDLSVLDLQDNLLDNFAISRTELVRNLQNLTLSDNRLHDLNESLPMSLRVLLLDGNLFRRFPLDIIGNISSIEMIKLSRNPWKCDCETLSFRKWLIAAGKKVVDVREIRCGDDEENGVLRNKVIISLQDIQLCPSKLTVYIPIAIGSLVFLFFGSSSLLLYYKNKLHIKVWLYAHGVTWVKEEDLDADKEFDAFLSYADKDSNFAIFTIAAGLETGQPRFNVFFPERNILPGEYEVVTNLTALTICRRFIVILSKAYVEDHMAMQNFRDAFSMSLKDKVNRLIVIQRGKLPDLSEIEPIMKTVLEATKPIVWREKMFWERLRYSMPKKSNKNPVQPPVIRQEEGNPPPTNEINSHQDEHVFHDDEIPLLD